MRDRGVQIPRRAGCANRALGALLQLGAALQFLKQFICTPLARLALGLVH